MSKVMLKDLYKNLSIKNPFWGISTAVAKLVLLNSAEKEITNATGFIIKEEKDLFLYTCWHVVSGFGYPNPTIPPNGNRIWPPERQKLKIIISDIKDSPHGGSSAGAPKEILIDLYRIEDGDRYIPLWIQGNSFDNEALQGVGITIPLRGDFIKIPIGIHLTETQKEYFFDYYCIKSITPQIGDQVVIAGYPYGFSVSGKGHCPDPVYLKRNVASSSPYLRKDGEDFSFLLDGACFPGMSGSPVFLQKDEELILFGIYTGSIFPDADHLDDQMIMGCNNDRLAALGKVTPLYTILDDFYKFNVGVTYDAERCGYFVDGDGFDFFAYFTGDETRTHIECDHVIREGYGFGCSVHISLSCERNIPSEEEFRGMIDEELSKNELFLIPSNAP